MLAGRPRSIGSSWPVSCSDCRPARLARRCWRCLGREISAATVSRVAKTLDAAVAAFHRRPLKNQYKALMLDGVVLARKTGAGALRRPVLVALGLRPDGKKEIIDFRLAASESAAEWERFLTDLFRRGLTGEGLDMICVDGGSGLWPPCPRSSLASRFSDAGRTRSGTSSTKSTRPTSRPPSVPSTRS